MVSPTKIATYEDEGEGQQIVNVVDTFDNTVWVYLHTRQGSYIYLGRCNTTSPVYRISARDTSSKHNTYISYQNDPNLYKIVGMVEFVAVTR